ncbi:hypothetical protein M8J77_013263 [Diaphorina citri]|nr:hypothetical protein M8J77_013263 [Diaphorina citri]
MSSSEETAAILKQLKIQGEVLQAILKNQATAASTKANTESTSPGAIVSHNITLEAFDPDEEDFSSYKERLENFFTMRGMTGQSQEHDSAKRSVLLGCLKRDQFKQLSALTVPHKPSEKSYNELVEILEKRFDPISNVHTERHRFLSRVQTKSESLTSYISALKMIGQKCQWVCHVENCKAQIDSIFQAQFIRGIRDHYIREKILVMKTETSLEKTLETALALEAAHKQNLEEYTSDAAPTQSTNVHKVSMHDNNSPYFRSRSRSRSSSHHRNRSTFNRNGSTYRAKSTTKERLQKLGIQDLQCLRCGKYNHTARQCRVNYRQLKCKSCNNTGHVESVCIRTKANKNQVNMVYADEEEFDVHYVNHTSDQYKIYDVLQNSEDKYARKIYVSVRLHDKLQKFELDTGSAVSILSRHDFEQLNLQIKITECPNIRFRAYNKQLIVPEGYVHIPITYNNKTIEDKLYIVSENFSPILGRIWSQKLDILFHYRNTPIAEGKSPAELHVGRTLRSKLHMLQPSTRSMPPDPVAVNTREFQVGQRVLSRHYLGADKWKTGTITERLGRIHYSVKLDNGPSVKRHVNQLKSTEYKQKQDEEDVIQPEETPKKVKTVTFTLPPVQLIPTQPPPPANNSTSSIPVQPRRRVRPVIDPESLRRSTRTRNPVQRLNYFIRGG